MRSGVVTCRCMLAPHLAPQSELVMSHFRQSESNNEQDEQAGSGRCSGGCRASNQRMIETVPAPVRPHCVTALTRLECASKARYGRSADRIRLDLSKAISGHSAPTVSPTNLGVLEGVTSAWQAN